MSLNAARDSIQGPRTTRLKVAVYVFWPLIAYAAPNSILTSARSQGKDVDKPAKLSDEASKELSKEVNAYVLSLVTNAKFPGKGSTDITLSANIPLSKTLFLLERATFGLVLQPGKGSYSVSKITFPARLTVKLAESRELDGVKLDKGTSLARSADGSWSARSKDLLDKQLAREKAAAQAKQAAADAAAMDEDGAAEKLKDIRKLVADGQVALARIRCQAIIDTHARTKAAAEARQLLEKLKKK
jgi:hypothetical protein